MLQATFLTAIDSFMQGVPLHPRRSEKLISGFAAGRRLTVFLIRRVRPRPTP